TWHHRDAFGAGSDDLGVVALDRGGRDHGLGPLDIGRVVARVHGDAQRGQAPRGGAFLLVGTRHGIAQVVQDLGDAAHARAADADEMDVLDGVLHADAPFKVFFTVSRSRSSATAAAARRRARARALSAMALRSARCRLRRRSASVAAVNSAWGRCTAAPWLAM